MLPNPFEKIKVSLNYKTGHVIQWWLNPQFPGKAPYSFTLSAYEDVGFKEPIFTKEVGEQFYAIDDSNVRQNSLSDYVYIVTLTTADGVEFKSDFVDWQPSAGADRHKWLMANEITRRETVGLRMFGIWSYLLKRKSYAPAALGEVDIVTGEPIVDTSAGSFGTGHTGGYFSPVLFKYYLTGFDQQMDYHTEGRGSTYREDLQIKTIGFPYIDSKDILVSIEGKRYNITRADDKFFPGTMIALQQIALAQIIPPTDTVYAIAVPPFPDE